jgi:hypothetical protein
MGDNAWSCSPLRVEWEIMRRYPSRKKGSCSSHEDGLGVLKLSCMSSRRPGSNRLECVFEANRVNSLKAITLAKGRTAVVEISWFDDGRAPPLVCVSIQHGAVWSNVGTSTHISIIET